jgi:hypothetical protein
MLNTPAITGALPASQVQTLTNLHIHPSPSEQAIKTGNLQEIMNSQDNIGASSSI